MMRFKRKTQNNHNTSDEELWAKILHGDRFALEKLYSRYFPTLYNYGLRFTKDDGMVEDAIQDLFMHLLVKPNVNHIKSIRAYLMIALRNNIIKLSTKNRSVSIDELPFDLAMSDEELFTLFFKDDNDYHIAQQLRKAYQSLNSNQKHAIYLYYVKSYTWEETAQILSISPHSCMNLVQRSVKKLHSLMFEEK